ncbi:HNH endonuclease [Microvirga sp. Mcv34]|uniref:HNH endonuclease n=1 Tax=Microvirga sp. Mcv34 TaxID=2926016 RepID=UPI0021C69A95|nr:HNH endonuclease signature motif containing protein [Microvirga sp. Mcv34]
MGKLTNIKPRLSSTPPRLKSPPKIVEEFYSSPEWRALVKRIKAKRGNFCQRCGSSDRVIADHIIERKDGGADLDENNIELLCHTHHQKKTAQARARRARGQA